ncbi:MAG TPA: hypothetical protein DCZ94_19965, partial [Lentisphaeria bacterium]|nr:hypothetical protein [Lentisphaeria bacterium]
RGEKDPMGRLVVAPAYVAYANLVKQIHDSKCMGREAFGKYTRAYVVRFRKSADEDILVCWGTYPSRIEVEASGPMISTNLMGEEKSLAPDSGKILVDLGNEPFFIRGSIQKVKEIESEEKIIASSADDYGKEQGFNNWNYGYFEVAPDQSSEGKYEFKEMNVVETMWGENWAGPYKFLSLGGGGAHPEIADGKQIWAVRRWKSGYAGKVQISGRCYREDEKGDGVEFVILQDGKEIFRRKVGGEAPMSTDIKLETDIREGSIVDFCVSPNSNTEYDSTSSDIMIKTIKI